MAYPQAPIEMDMYMELSTGIHIKHKNSRDHVLKLLANKYGQKQAGCVWNSYLSPSYGRSTSSSHLLTIASITGIMSFLLSTLMMESSWDHWTNSYVTSSTSYVTSSYPLKIKATLLIMLELVSRNSRTAHWTDPTSLNWLHHFWCGPEQLQGQGCTSQGKWDIACSFRQASFLVEFCLPFGHRQAQLFGSNHEARYYLRNSPTCQVLIRPKRTS